MGASEANGWGVGGVGRRGLARTHQKNRERDMPQLWSYIEIRRPYLAMESLQPAMFGRLTPIRTTYAQRGITTTSDVRTTYYHLDDLDRAIVSFPMIFWTFVGYVFFDFGRFVSRTALSWPYFDPKSTPLTLCGPSLTNFPSILTISMTLSIFGQPSAATLSSSDAIYSE